MNPIDERADYGIGLTAIVTTDGDGDGLAELVGAYLTALDGLGTTYELIFLHDHASSGAAEAARSLSETWPALKPVALRPWPGEDGALKVGVDQARGARVLTLPGWSEISPAEIGALVDALGEDDMVVGRRDGVGRSALQRLRMGATHGLISLLFGKRFEDVFCRARVGRTEMFAKITDLGVRQHFLPVVAVAEGWRVRETPVAPAAAPPRPPVYTFKPLAHVSALVDLMTLFVGLKFLRRPLRFFGAIGLPLFLIGCLATAWLIVSRLFFGEALGDRPALVFSVMTLILGLQIVALGLIGEIVIFASTRRMRSYEIETIIRGRPTKAEAGEPAAAASASASAASAAPRETTAPVRFPTSAPPGDAKS